MTFELQYTDPKSNARAGLITTDHGPIETPIFMPVGTLGTVKGVHLHELKEDIQAQIRSCIHALDRIKDANRPAPVSTAKVAAPVFDYERSESAAKQDAETEAVANEIAQSLEALVGTTDEPAPKIEPKHPVSDTTGKFANLQFGRNYDPSRR